MPDSHRVSLIISSGPRILLLYRKKAEREYYVFPGGGVEEGETIEAAAVREAKEETGFDVSLERKLWEADNRGRTEHYFLVTKFSGEMKIGGPEANRQSSANIYRLTWVDASTLPTLPLVPEDMGARVAQALGTPAA